MFRWISGTSRGFGEIVTGRRIIVGAIVAVCVTVAAMYIGLALYSDHKARQIESCDGRWVPKGGLGGTYDDGTRWYTKEDRCLPYD